MTKGDRILKLLLVLFTLVGGMVDITMSYTFTWDVLRQWSFYGGVLLLLFSAALMGSYIYNLKGDK